MNVSIPSAARRAVLASAMIGLARVAIAQPLAAGANSSSEPAAMSVLDWLQRMHVASRKRSYIGTFVVSAPGGNLSSARIWHACEGDQQIERIEALSGPRRATFRRNDLVLTFLPETKVVKSERRENLELFPNLLGTPEASLAELYGARVIGKGRVAGFEADVVQPDPRAGLRFGYRIWSEHRSGLVVKLQTLDGEGQVVEQSAFSELQLDAPLKVQALSQMMDSTAGYRIEKSELKRTSAEAEGWALKGAVPGFKPTSCYRRAMGGDGTAERMVQWTFSDGLASVSLFLEPYDAQRQLPEILQTLGATHTLTRRLTDVGGDWWLTAVGEVPPRALDAFARGLTRTR